MSLAHALKRNKAIYDRLSRGGVPEKTAPTPSFEEHGEIPETRFLEMLEQARPPIEKTVYSLDAPPPSAFSRDEAASAPPRLWRRPEIAPPINRQEMALKPPAQPEIGKIIYPESGAPITADAPPDLLDSLLRRLESNARKYPQDLGGGESTW